MTGNYLFIVVATLAVVLLIGCGNGAPQEELEPIDPKLAENEAQFMKMESENKKLLEETVKLQARLTALRDENQTVSASLTEVRWRQLSWESDLMILWLRTRAN